MLMRIIINSIYKKYKYSLLQRVVHFTVPLFNNVQVKQLTNTNDNNFYLHRNGEMYNSVKTPIHIKY